MDKHTIAQHQLKGFYLIWCLLRNSPLGWQRRLGLKAKTIGLTYHDRTMTRGDDK